MKCPICSSWEMTDKVRHEEGGIVKWEECEMCDYSALIETYPEGSEEKDPDFVYFAGEGDERMKVNTRRDIRQV